MQLSSVMPTSVVWFFCHKKEVEMSVLLAVFYLDLVGCSLFVTGLLCGAAGNFGAYLRWRPKDDVLRVTSWVGFLSFLLMAIGFVLLRFAGSI